MDTFQPSALEAILLSLLTLGALALLVERRASRGSVAFGVGLMVLVAAGAVAWATSTERRLASEHAAEAVRPARVTELGYVSSTTCRKCHPEEYATWYASYHRTMTQLPDPETVVAPFDGSVLSTRGLDYVAERRGDEFWVRCVGPTPGAATRQPVPWDERRIVLLTGSHHQQVFWITAGRGREIEVFPLSWLIAEQRWIPYENSFLRPDLEHPPPVRWNNNCIKCHSTGGQPKLVGGRYGVPHSKVGEFGIACESCHGPAQEHVRAHTNPLRRVERRREGADPTIVNPAKLPANLSSQVCGQCHAVYKPLNKAMEKRWMAGDGFVYRPGDELSKTHRIEKTLDPGYAWPDGKVRVPREYSALSSGACWSGGEISCLSCHSMHGGSRDDQLAPGMRGDVACTQCHEDIAATLEAHTHHPAGSEGSRCYNCHMPNTTFALFKAMRSHVIQSPSVRKTVTTGQPNACNLCHADKTLAWTSKHLQEWYGHAPVELDDEQRSTSSAVLQLLKGDAAQRAFITWTMRWGPAREASGGGGDWFAPFLGTLLADPYPAVRLMAGEALKDLDERYKAVGYDFLAPPRRREAARAEVWKLWREFAKQSKGASHGDAILIPEAGRLDVDRLRRILEKRDDRHVDLFE